MSEARSLRRRPVVDYRQWLDTRGGGGPFGPLKDLPAQPPQEQLLDRKTFHTDLCPSCSGVRASPQPGRSTNLAGGGVCQGRKLDPSCLFCVSVCLCDPAAVGCFRGTCSAQCMCCCVLEECAMFFKALLLATTASLCQS